MRLRLQAGAAPRCSRKPTRGAPLSCWPSCSRSTWFISTAMAAHLPRLLQATGATLRRWPLSSARWSGRRRWPGGCWSSVLRRVHPLLSARLAAHGIRSARWRSALLGAPAAAVFAVLHGAGNGILTIAKGTLPLVLFGPQGYGQRQGLLMVPARMAQALAPWLFGLGLDRWGAGALWLSALLGLSACAALWWMPAGAR